MGEDYDAPVRIAEINRWSRAEVTERWTNCITFVAIVGGTLALVAIFHGG